MKLSETMLGKSLFWEAVVSELDMEVHAMYIVPRVMDYGTLEDVRFVMKYYGKPRIKEILLDAPALQRRTISFFASYFSLPQDSFKAYNRLKSAQWSR